MFQILSIGIWKYFYWTFDQSITFLMTLAICKLNFRKVESSGRGGRNCPSPYFNFWLRKGGIIKLCNYINHHICCQSIFKDFVNMKVLLILAENIWKTEIKLFALCAISHENESYSQIFCELLSLETFFWL